MIWLLSACLWIPADDPLPGPADTDIAVETDLEDETDPPVDTDLPVETDPPVDTDPPPDTDLPVDPPPTWRALLLVRHFLGMGSRMEVSLQLDGRIDDPWWRWFAPDEGACATSYPWTPTWIDGAAVDVTLRAPGWTDPLDWGDAGPHRTERAEIAARTRLGVESAAWGGDGPGAFTLPDMLTVDPPGSFNVTAGRPGTYDTPLVFGQGDVTVRWTPSAGERVLIRVLGQGPPYAVIRCVVPDTDGSALIPAALLEGWEAGQTLDVYVARGGPATVGDPVDGVLPVGVELEWYQGFGRYLPE